MNKLKVLKWSIVTPLSVIGLVAIVFLITQAILTSRSVTTSSYYGGDIMVENYVPSASMAYDSYEMKTMSSLPHERLYDEAIAAEVDQKIIKTENLDLIVDSTEEGANVAQNVAEKYEGYVSSVSIREMTDGTKSGTVIIRVPVASFESAAQEIKDVALVVERETIATEDVTEQYIDIAARLSNAQAQEKRYIEILDKADTVEDMLSIEQALWSVRATIESYQGQLNYLDSQTDFSTITVNLSEEPVITIGGKEFRPGTSVKEAAQALVALTQWLIISVIWIVIVGGGIGIPVTLLVWLGWKLVKHYRNKRT